MLLVCCGCFAAAARHLVLYILASSTWDTESFVGVQDMPRIGNQPERSSSTRHGYTTQADLVSREAGRVWHAVMNAPCFWVQLTFALRKSGICRGGRRLWPERRWEMGKPARHLGSVACKSTRTASRHFTICWWTVSRESSCRASKNPCLKAVIKIVGHSRISKNNASGARSADATAFFFFWIECHKEQRPAV